MSCFIIVAVVWVFSVCLHEYGHAKIAQLGGDYTVEEKGYLSMNPMHYADPVMSFVLPILFMILGGIGLPGGAFISIVVSFAHAIGKPPCPWLDQR